MLASPNNFLQPTAPHVLWPIVAQCSTELSLLFLAIEKGIPFGCSMHGIQKENSFLHGLTGAGSGIEDVFTQINNFGTFEPLSKNNLGLPEKTISFTLSLISHISQMELYFGSTILHYYGGGFEIAVMDRGEIKKLDDISYVFWDAKEIAENESSISFPSKIIKYGMRQIFFLFVQ